MTIKINAGCGRHVLDGWINVDAQISPKAKRPPEHVCDLRQIPLPDGCAHEVMAIHVFEHFYYWEAQDVIAEWRRLLAKGGLLVLELPNLVKCCQNLLSGQMYEAKHPHQMSMWGIYGDPQGRDPFMHHKWGWTPHSLIEFLQSHGFKDAQERPTKWHLVGQKHRDMRIEAIAH